MIKVEGYLRMHHWYMNVLSTHILQHRNRFTKPPKCGCLFTLPHMYLPLILHQFCWIVLWLMLLLFYNWKTYQWITININDKRAKMLEVCLKYCSYPHYVEDMGLLYNEEYVVGVWESEWEYGDDYRHRHNAYYNVMCYER